MLTKPPGKEELPSTGILYELVSIVNRRPLEIATGMPPSKGSAPSRPRPSATRTQDPDGTRRHILEVASKEFALNGLSGARIDEIAARTRFSKRMIYYYFRDKEGLYLAALEEAYRQVRSGEAQLDTQGLSPVEALTRLV